MNRAVKSVIPATLVIVLCFGAIKAKEAKKRTEEKAQMVAQENKPESPEVTRGFAAEAEDLAQNFERMASSWFVSPFWSERVGTQRMFDRNVVKLPKVEFLPEKDGQGLVIEIKGLSAKKEDIKGQVGAGGQFALFTFTSDDTLMGIKVYRNSIDVMAQMDVTEEKKNPKGEILSSSTYKAANMYSRSLPRVIDPAHLVAEYANGTLRIKAESYQSKAIDIK